MNQEEISALAEAVLNIELENHLDYAKHSRSTANRREICNY